MPSATKSITKLGCDVTIEYASLPLTYKPDQTHGAIRFYDGAGSEVKVVLSDGATPGYQAAVSDDSGSVIAFNDDGIEAAEEIVEEFGDGN